MNIRGRLVQATPGLIFATFLEIWNYFKTKGSKTWTGSQTPDSILCETDDVGQCHWWDARRWASWVTSISKVSPGAIAWVSPVQITRITFPADQAFNESWTQKSLVRISHRSTLNTHFYTEHHSKWFVCVRKREREVRWERKDKGGYMKPQQTRKDHLYIHTTHLGSVEGPTHLWKQLGDTDGGRHRGLVLNTRNFSKNISKQSLGNTYPWVTEHKPSISVWF